jgi:O-antigen/teichoic acid export membrane protein
MGFGFGVAGTALLVLCLTQLDKLLLGRLLSLSDLGAYTLAVTLTSVQVLLVQPVHTAIYPQLAAQLHAPAKDAAAAATFLRWSRRVSVVVLPLGVAMCLFPEEIARLWLRDAALAAEIAVPVALLSLGSTLNALCTLPYTLQLASGWASLGLYSNLIAVTLMVPAILVLAPRFGMAGAAAVWAVLNFGYLAIQIPIMFRRLLVPYRRRWFLDAVVYPTFAALLLLGSARGMADVYELDGSGAFLCCLAGAAVAALLLAHRAHRIETSTA